MNASENDIRIRFTNKMLLVLLVPLMVEQLLAATIGAADTLMVTSVGEAALSGVSIVDQINILLIQIFAALATGGAVVIAQYIGQGERKSACSAAKQLVYASTGLASAIALAALLFARPILRGLFGTIDDAVMKNAHTYFVYSVLSYPFLAIYNAGVAVQRAMGDSKSSMKIGILTNVTNVFGNALLIFVFKWGVAGAAIASLFSRALGAVIVMLLLRDRRHPVFIDRLFKPEWSFAMIRRILRIGVPNGIENSMFQIGKLALVSLVSTFGTASIAANAMCNTTTSFICIPASAIGMGMITVVGQCMGAGDIKGAQRNCGKLIAFSYMLLFVSCSALFIFAPQVVSVFNLSEEASQIAIQISRLYSVGAFVLWTPSFVLPNALRAAGDARFTLVVSSISMWVLRVGAGYLLAKTMHLGVLGVWIGMQIDWVGRIVCFVIRYFGGKWKTKTVI